MNMDKLQSVDFFQNQDLQYAFDALTKVLNREMITNYMMKPTFVDDKEYDSIFLSKHINFDEGFIVNSKGILEYIYTSEKDRRKIKEVYKINEVNPVNIYKELSANLSNQVGYNFIYETIFKKKMYTKDQIYAESNVSMVLSFSEQLKMIEMATTNYILGEENILENSIKIDESDKLEIYKDIISENFYYKDKDTNLIISSKSKNNINLIENFFDNILMEEK